MRPFLIRYPVFAAFAVACIFSSPAQAQFRVRHAPAPPPDVLNPAPRIWRLGFILGMGLNSHDGDFLPECDACFFSDGSANGVVGGLQLEHMITPSIGVAVKLLYDDRRGEFTSTILDMPRLVKPPEGSGLDPYTENIDVERTMNAELAYAVLHPVIELFPLRDLYVFAGPGIGIPVVNRYKVVERPLDDSFVYASTGASEMVLGRQDFTDIPEPASPMLDIRAGLGYNIRFGPGVMLAPEVSYVYPFTNVSDSDDNWSVSAIHAVAVLKFRL